MIQVLRFIILFLFLFGACGCGEQHQRIMECLNTTCRPICSQCALCSRPPDKQAQCDECIRTCEAQ